MFVFRNSRATRPYPPIAPKSSGTSSGGVLARFCPRRAFSWATPPPPPPVFVSGAAGGQGNNHVPIPSLGKNSGNSLEERTHLDPAAHDCRYLLFVIGCSGVIGVIIMFPIPWLGKNSGNSLGERTHGPAARSPIVNGKWGYSPPVIGSVVNISGSVIRVYREEVQNYKHAASGGAETERKKLWFS